MAIIKCEECGKEISDKAPHCVHCGVPIEPLMSGNQNEKIKEPEDSGADISPTILTKEKSQHPGSPQASDTERPSPLFDIDLDNEGPSTLKGIVAFGGGIGVIALVVFFLFPAMKSQQDESWRTSQNKLGFITGNVSPNNLTCSELMDEIFSRSFQNSQNEEIRLLRFDDVHLLEQNNEKIECLANSLFSNGSEGRFVFYVDNSDSGSSIGFFKR